MTERASRAARELERRGWTVETQYEKECRGCGALLPSGYLYCGFCGTKVPTEFQEGTLADVEAAIVAALEEKKE